MAAETAAGPRPEGTRRRRSIDDTTPSPVLPSLPLASRLNVHSAPRPGVSALPPGATLASFGRAAPRGRSRDPQITVEGAYADSRRRFRAAAERPPRRKRVFAALGVTVAALAMAIHAVWPRAGASPTVASAAADAPAAASKATVLPNRIPGAGGVAGVMAPPPIEFSFAKFEADPALVAGAASTGVPNISGEAGIVVDVSSKDVLYAKQPHQHHLMASTAKIMAAIVVAEHGRLDKIITVPAEATQVEPNHMGIKAGEKLTVQELLYGMLLDSGNDAAEALAYGIGGGGAAGRAQFVAWMNQKVGALGLKDTHFVNPSGLDDPDAYSSAYDLAVMGAYALTKPELKTIFGTKDVVINPSKEAGHEHGWFNPGNLNSLLTTYRGAIGIKPGYTEDAGYTLVAAAERDGRTLVAVTLNSRRHFGDCAQLLDFGFSH